MDVKDSERENFDLFINFFVNGWKIWVWNFIWMLNWIKNFNRKIYFLLKITWMFIRINPSGNHWNFMQFKKLATAKPKQSSNFWDIFCYIFISFCVFLLFLNENKDCCIKIVHSPFKYSFTFYRFRLSVLMQ